MSYLLRSACITGFVLASLSNLHAATVCSSIAAKRQPQAVATGAHAPSARAPKHACAQNCEVAGLQGRGDVVDGLPVPMHLPVVSDPDEVAAWHAEIFEQLADARSGGNSSQVCRVNVRGRPVVITQ
jgi:hypothetical protein